jgi:predicted MFS family arabinose efflux permease
MPAASLLPRVRDLGKEIEKMLAASSRHGRRCHRRAESSWQAMVSVKNFHRSARARPPPADTPDESSAVTTSQVTPSIHDFAVSLGVLAGFALLNAVTAVSGWYPLTFAARLLAGVMGGTLWSMLAGYAARMVPARQRGRAIAVVLAGITVALSAGIPAGTALAGAVGWRASFGLLAGLALLLTAWIRWQVPAFAGEPADRRAPLRRVARQPGIRAVLAVTVLLLTGHQAMYTYVAPFAPGRTSVVLLVFGGATVAGIWITGVVADRYLRPVLLAALGLIAVAMLVLGLAARAPAALLAAAALWGAAFGGAPTLLQTALVDASGPASADVATALQTTVYNVGIAAGSLAGGLVLGGAGAAALPWVTLVFTVAALGIVGAARRTAFPPERREERGIPGRVALLPRA